MQKLTGIVSLCLPLYGLVRVAGVLNITLNDTESQFHTFELQCGIFWDSALIKKINRADPSVVSTWKELTIRQLNIKHRPWNPKDTQ